MACPAAKDLDDLWKSSSRLVIPIDPVDADNFPLPAMAALADPEKQPLAIVLERRAVNFGWAHWKDRTDPSGAFPNMQARILHRITALQQAGEPRIPKGQVPYKWLVKAHTKEDHVWINKLDELERQWFQEAPHNSQHSDVYMEISRIRLYNFMSSSKVPSSQYEIFLQNEVPSIVTGIQHQQHVRDWFWGLNEEIVHAEIATCKARDPHMPYSKDRGTCIHDALVGFIKRFHQSAHPLAASAVTLYPHNTEEALDQWFSRAMPGSARTYKYLVGGPMTIVANHYRQHPSTIQVCVAMLAAFSKRSILLDTQFNQMIDEHAALYMMRESQAGRLPMWLISTEIAKNPHWQFDLAQLKQTFGEDSAMVTLAMQFSVASNLAVSLFDLMTAVAVHFPQVLPPAVPATFYQDEDKWVALQQASLPTTSSLHVFGLSLVKPDVTGQFPDLTNLLAWSAANADSMRQSLKSVFNP